MNCSLSLDYQIGFHPIGLVGNDRFGQPEGLAVNLYVRRAPPDSPLSPWGGAQLGVILSFKLPRTAGNLILASGRCVCVVKSPLFSEWHRLKEKVGFRAVWHAPQRQQGTAGKRKRAARRYGMRNTGGRAPPGRQNGLADGAQTRPARHTLLPLAIRPARHTPLPAEKHCFSA